jgi:hypothetical protein
MHMPPELHEQLRVFTQKVGKGSWQYDAISQLREVLKTFLPDTPQLNEKLPLRTWFAMFAELRNKTRGHGAITPSSASKVVKALNESISNVGIKNPMFNLPWIFLHRNMSGKYSVKPLSGDEHEIFKITREITDYEDAFSDGIYIWIGGRPRPLDLLKTDLDCGDFYFPNGNFKDSSFELHSPITDTRQKGDATPYLKTPLSGPASETEGKGELELFGKVLTNLPTLISTYVSRQQLECDVLDAVSNDRHAVVTLKGRGGIGKTSLTLEVLRRISAGDRFDLIIWFSARDIDLLTTGAKPVQQKVMSEKDIADFYCHLVGLSSEERASKKSSQEILAAHFRLNPNGKTLFVFDNFETLRNPIDVFKYIDTNIRLPNKAIITTRFRDFKADYPIDVPGMSFEEANGLISRTASQLRIEPLIGEAEKGVIFDQSNGHPYVIKIIMGSIADNGKFVKPAKIIASKDEILDALFDRTFANLLPVSQRIFLTLSAWRSLVPQPAVEAVLFRHVDDDVNPEAGIDQLLRMSLIERTQAEDGTDFLEVPLTAATFGKRKLEVSPIKTIIEADLRFLQEIGPTTKSNLKEGLGPRIDLFFRGIAKRLSNGSDTLSDMRAMMEFLARKHPPAWLQLSEIEQERREENWKSNASEYIRRYLETQPAAVQAQLAWQKLFFLYRLEGNAVAGCNAFLSFAKTSAPPYTEISAMANWLNTDAKWKKILDESERRILVLPLIRLMEDRRAEANATDLSRLAWLYLSINEADRAMATAQAGLRERSDNAHCRKIVEKLSLAKGSQSGDIKISRPVRK